MTHGISSLVAVTAISVCTVWPGTAAAPVVADPHRDPLFTTSDACAVCHIAAPGASAMKAADDADVSPYYTWQATMMANAFRDPYFRAQLRKESAAAGEQVHATAAADSPRKVVQKETLDEVRSSVPLALYGDEPRVHVTPKARKRAVRVVGRSRILYAGQ